MEKAHVLAEIVACNEQAIIGNESVCVCLKFKVKRILKTQKNRRKWFWFGFLMEREGCVLWIGDWWLSLKGYIYFLCF